MSWSTNAPAIQSTLNQLSQNIIVFDQFNRADNASSLGKAATGQTWETVTGTWGILGNQAYVAANVIDSLAVINSGTSDGVVKTTFSKIGTIIRLVFRYTGSSAVFLLASISGGYSLFRINGAGTVIGSTPGTANGDRIEVVLLGSSIQVKINGVVKISVTDTFNQTATKHGFSLGNNPPDLTVRWDDFSVEV